MPKGLSILLLLIASQTLRAQLTYQTLMVDYDSAVTYKNLKIIPVRPKGGFGNQTRLLYNHAGIISFSQGIRQGTVVLSERGTASTENVHWLRINNNSGKPVFIASGEVIMGGRQDRMVTMDTVLLSSSKDQYIPVMCVEEDRWSEKEKKFAYHHYANPRLRKLLDQSKNQVLIWKEIYAQLESSSTKSASLAYLAQRQDKRIIGQQTDYFNYFDKQLRKNDSTIVGFVCMSGDRVIGCDIFAGTHLFYASLESLLYGYIEEAVLNGQPVTISDEKVKTYLDRILTDEASQREYLKKHGKIYKYEGKVFHITGYAE